MSVFVLKRVLPIRRILAFGLSLMWEVLSLETSSSIFCSQDGFVWFGWVVQIWIPICTVEITFVNLVDDYTVLSVKQIQSPFKAWVEFQFQFTSQITLTYFLGRSRFRKGILSPFIPQFQISYQFSLHLALHFLVGQPTPRCFEKKIQTSKLATVLDFRGGVPSSSHFRKSPQIGPFGWDFAFGRDHHNNTGVKHEAKSKFKSRI